MDLKVAFLKSSPVYSLLNSRCQNTEEIFLVCPTFCVIQVYVYVNVLDLEL